MEKIKMINCPICGNAICSNVGFNCLSECEYGKNKYFGCLQMKNKNSCKCSNYLIKEHFIKKYSLDKNLTTKEMIIEVSHLLYNFISLLNDEDFNLHI